jgi:hypothetical protein
MTLLQQLGIKTDTLFRVEIYFETNDVLDEEAVELEIRKERQSSHVDPDLSDWMFQPGSPASPPCITVSGPSRKHVEHDATQIVRLLQELQIQISR